MEWSDQAACLTAEPELFFPAGTGGAAMIDVHAAKAVCRRCAVIDECRDYALRSRQPFGVWGGLDEEERKRAWHAEPAVALT